MRPFLAIEGTVGAGKTTLIERVADGLGLKPFYELSDPSIEDLLKYFYEDRKRWAFTLQILFLTSRYEQLRKACSFEKVVLDRSLFGDIVFARMLHLYGDMNDSEMMVYSRLYRALVSSVFPPFLMVYIRIPTDLAVERIRERGRDYELRVEREYWNRLNSEYERFFEEYTLSPLLIINAERYDWVNDEEDSKRVVSEIEKHLRDSIKGVIQAGWRKEI